VFVDNEINDDKTELSDTTVECVHVIQLLRRLFSVDAAAHSTTSTLVAPRTVRATIGDRTFPAAAASGWNSLPESVRASPSLQVFRGRLKTELFARSYSYSD